MAHGSDAQWNQAVQEAARPLARHFPVEIAFGMADPHSLGRAVEALERRGVGRIVVVRLFISGKSFLEQTEYFLGTRQRPPAQFVLHSKDPNAVSPVLIVPPGPDLVPIGRSAEIGISYEGLSDSSWLAKILADRLSDLTQDPSSESILVIAHGEGEDVENKRWVSQLRTRLKMFESLGDFGAVLVTTLREDWPDKRREARLRIRKFAARSHREGLNLIVLPCRVFGFGPYQEVLEGYEYRANHLGLLPHPGITYWIAEQTAQVAKKMGWPDPVEGINLDAH